MATNTAQLVWERRDSATGVAVTVSDGDFSAFSRLQVLPLAEDAGTVEDAEASEEDEVCYSYEFLLFSSLSFSASR